MRFITSACLAILIIVAAWSALAKENLGPSFDCNKATTSTEYAICGSSFLSELDQKLSKIYKAVKKKLPLNSVEETSLLVEQRLWIKERTTECGDRIRCLARMYRERISVLSEEYDVEEVLDDMENSVHENTISELSVDKLEWQIFDSEKNDLNCQELCAHGRIYALDDKNNAIENSPDLADFESAM